MSLLPALLVLWPLSPAPWFPSEASWEKIQDEPLVSERRGGAGRGLESRGSGGRVLRCSTAELVPCPHYLPEFPVPFLVPSPPPGPSVLSQRHPTMPSLPTGCLPKLYSSLHPAPLCRVATEKAEDEMN